MSKKTKSIWVVTSMVGGEVEGYWKDIEIEDSIDLSIVTRFEIIDRRGRQLVEKGNFTLQLQDDGRTLKLIKNENT